MASSVPGQLTLLLPARRRLAGQAPGAALARALGRADALPSGEDGERAQLLRHFDLLPRGWPLAAITRQMDAGDARQGQWLRADPAHVRPDMTGARLMACGDLGLDKAEAESLLKPLRPLFGDTGFPLSAPHPSRWYLQLPVEAKLPAFSPPEAVLGDDLFAHLPEGPEGKRWRALLNEAQVLLHNHEVNAARLEAGKLPVNSLWFWGGGKLPDHVTTHAEQVETDADELKALVALCDDRKVVAGHVLVDLRDQRQMAAIEASHLSAALARLGKGELAEVVLDFADGAQLTLRPGQRWRFWRKPAASLA